MTDDSKTPDESGHAGKEPGSLVLPDIILADDHGDVRLVRGEKYIDALLYNDLPPDVSVAVIEVANRREAFAMWVENGGDPGSGATMWAINPLIVARIRGDQGKG